MSFKPQQKNHSLTEYELLDIHKLCSGVTDYLLRTAPADSATIEALIEVSLAVANVTADKLVGPNHATTDHSLLNSFSREQLEERIFHIKAVKKHEEDFNFIKTRMKDIMGSMDQGKGDMLEEDMSDISDSLDWMEDVIDCKRMRKSKELDQYAPSKKSATKKCK